MLKIILSDKVSGVNYATGKPTNKRIIINGELLVYVPTEESREKPYAPATENPLIKEWGEDGPNCAFIGTNPPGKTVWFMKEGVLLSPYKLDIIAV